MDAFYILNGFDGFLVGGIFVLSLAFIIAFLTVEKGSLQSRILAVALMSSVGFINVVYIFKYSGALNNAPLLVMTNFAARFLAAPLIYLYCLSITRPFFKFKMIYLIYFVPAAMCFAIEMPYLSHSDPINVFFVSDNMQRNILFVIRNLLNLFYVGLIIHELYRFNLRLKNEFSNIEDMKLNWFKLFITLTLVVWIVQLYYFYFVSKSMVIGGKKTFLDYGDSIALLVALTILLIVALRQSSITQFSQAQNLDLLENEDWIDSPQYYLSTSDDAAVMPGQKLDYARIERTKNKLLTHINERKSYLKSALKLHDLANELNVPSYLVSQAINHGLHSNFYDFINSYRIEAAKALLTDHANDNFTVLAIANDAGFNSKSVFNDVFKKATGLTPSQFRLQVQTDESKGQISLKTGV